MIYLRKNKYNLILGAIIGLVLAQFVIVEGNAILIQKLQIHEVMDSELGNKLIRYINIFAIIIFLLSIVTFNTKKLRKINFDKISIFLILVVLISLFVAFEGTIFLCQIIIKIIPNLQYYIVDNYFISVNMIYIILFVGISIFLITFISLVNRKVKYIRFLTIEVKKIKKEGFGKTIEVKGGDELADLCKSINDMSLELGARIQREKKIEDNKHELITNISHDLKTPLTSIVGYLELLSRENIDEETRDEYIKIAYNKSLRLKSLVNELFEYTKLTGNDMKLEENRINISMLLNQAVGESIINFSKRNIEVELNNSYNELFCNIDPLQMLRVFENLIRNAEKYADSDSKFIVSVNVIDDNVEISFINKCAGLVEDDIEKFFERFYRQDKSRNKEGTGLGLAIVQRIIELHHGSITAEKIDENIKFNIILQKA